MTPDEIAASILLGLSAYCQTPTALLAARNGGAESILRMRSLEQLQADFECMATTESSRRADARIFSNGAEHCAAVFEFKNNILHAGQVGAIVKNHLKAGGQLEVAEAPPGAPRIYVHGISSLVRLGACEWVDQHNAVVGTPYKKFQNQDQIEPLLYHAEAVIGWPARSLLINPGPFNAHVTLHVWIGQLMPDGQMVELNA